MEKLGLNGGFLFAQIVNFIIVLAAVGFFAIPRVLKAMDSRTARIAKALEDARVAEQARANAERDAQKMLEERRGEGNKLVDEARARAEQQARTVIEEAQREASALKSKAMAEGETAKSAALGDVRSDVISLAMAAAERLIGQSLDQGRSQAIISDFFSKSSADLKGLGDQVEVTSALPLTEAETGNVKAATGANNISYKVDPSILGGLIVRAGDKVVDGSTRAGLNSLASQLK